jgi:K+-sensing histidine kinase KdpD
MSSVNRLISIYEELDDSENLIVFLKLKNELLEEFNNKKMYRSEYLIEEQSWSKEKEVLESLAKRRQLLFALIGIIATLMTMLVITMLVNRRKLKINSNELKRVNSELQSTIRSRDVIYAVIAHDLRGPIGTSASLLDMITQQDGDEEDNKFLLEKIKVSMASSYILLENLLSWANLKMGDLRFHPDYYNISSIVEDQSQIFAEQASSKQIVLNNKVSKNMQAYFDFNTISTVVRNLISNALKFSVSGSEITFYAKIVDQNLHFCVQDRGIGMNDLTLSQLFDSAELRSTKGTNNESGSGLGLKLCKEFVLMNKGQIWAESTVDQGSTFYFSIPLQNTSEIV